MKKKKRLTGLGQINKTKNCYQNQVQTKQPLRKMRKIVKMQDDFVLRTIYKCLSILTPL